jgi:hypothetical protein
VLQAGKGLSFPTESLDKIIGGDSAARQHFERNLPVETDLPRTVDDTHAAATDLLQQLVIAQSREGNRAIAVQPAGFRQTALVASF